MTDDDRLSRERLGRERAERDRLLDAIEADLDGVEHALGRLDAGTYWTDEVTGAPLPDELLVADPTARRRPVPSDPAS